MKTSTVLMWLGGVVVVLLYGGFIAALVHSKTTREPEVCTLVSFTTIDTTVIKADSSDKSKVLQGFVVSCKGKEEEYSGGRTRITSEQIQTLQIGMKIGCTRVTVSYPWKKYVPFSDETIVFLTNCRLPI